MAFFLKAQWQDIIMANYAIPEEVLLAYLPAGVTLDLHEGKAYASLVGFLFKNSRIFGVPIPYFGTFEEVNLRFYVKRTVGNTVQRGVVFINETIPYRIVAWMANKLYYEHYTVIPTKHKINYTSTTKEVLYEWKINNQWNSLRVSASLNETPIVAGSFEEYIYDHLYGYTKVTETKTIEYSLDHPLWPTNKVHSYNINCHFDKMYGPDFKFLNEAIPHSVFITEGSWVKVNWQRNTLQF